MPTKNVDRHITEYSTCMYSMRVNWYCIGILIFHIYVSNNLEAWTKLVNYISYALFILIFMFNCKIWVNKCHYCVKIKWYAAKLQDINLVMPFNSVRYFKFSYIRLSILIVPFCSQIRMLWISYSVICQLTIPFHQVIVYLILRTN